MGSSQALSTLGLVSIFNPTYFLSFFCLISVLSTLVIKAKKERQERMEIVLIMAGVR